MQKDQLPLKLDNLIVQDIEIVHAGEGFKGQDLGSQDNFNNENPRCVVIHYNVGSDVVKRELVKRQALVTAQDPNGRIAHFEVKEGMRRATLKEQALIGTIPPSITLNTDTDSFIVDRHSFYSDRKAWQLFSKDMFNKPSHFASVESMRTAAAPFRKRWFKVGQGVSEEQLEEVYAMADRAIAEKMPPYYACGHDRASGCASGCPKLCGAVEHNYGRVGYSAVELCAAKVLQMDKLPELCAAR